MVLYGLSFGPDLDLSEQNIVARGAAGGMVSDHGGFEHAAVDEGDDFCDRSDNSNGQQEDGGNGSSAGFIGLNFNKFSTEED